MMNVPTITKLAERIPGLLDRSDYGDLSKLKPGLLEYVLQEHLAQRAGRHFDLRFGPKYQKMFSWALPKGLPQPKQRHLAIQQPLHEGSYAEFEGIIRSRYGKGEVKKADRGQVLITKITPSKINFVVAHHKQPEYYSLIKTKKDKDWIILNTTPQRVIPHEKVHYHKIPAEQVEQLFDKKYLASQKIDGAAALVRLLGRKIDVLSYRRDSKGRPIYHTLRINPKGLQAKDEGFEEEKILRGELFGVDPSGSVVSASDLGGLLNSSVANALSKQLARNIKLRVALFDELNVDKPYAERYEDVKKYLAKLPEDVFTTPKTTDDPEEMKRMWEAISSGSDPITREGMVFTPKDKGKPTKVKITPESRVIIRSIFPGLGKYYGAGAGGFEYSSPDKPEILGRVGTGFSDADRKDMLKHPDDWIGRTARILAQEQFPSGAYRAPSFIARHEDYTPQVKTAGISKSLLKALKEYRESLYLFTQPKNCLTGACKISDRLTKFNIPHDKVALPYPGLHFMVKLKDDRRIHYTPRRRALFQEDPKYGTPGFEVVGPKFIPRIELSSEDLVRLKGKKIKEFLLARKTK